MKHLHKSNYFILALFEVFFFIFFPPLLTGGGARTARAAASASSVVTAFEQSNVLDDLEGATFGGKNLDFSTYNFDESKNVQVISFIEFCYSYRTEKQGNYGLYIYIYNPRGEDFTKNQGLNQIELRVGGDESRNFDKYPLKYLNRSEKAGYEGLFYKFKIDLSAEQKSAIIALLNSSARIYELSGIELYSGGDNASDYNISNKYTYTGFAQGYGSDSATSDSLSCMCEGLDLTLSLDVKSMQYRPEGTSGNEFTQDILYSVYFSIPNQIISEYGGLSAVHATWLNATTRNIWVTANSEIYSALNNWIQENDGFADLNNYPDYTLLANAKKQLDIITLIPGQNGKYATLNYDTGYNLAGILNEYKNKVSVDDNDLCWGAGRTALSVYGQYLHYLFFADNNNAADYVLTGEKVLEYIKTYSKNKGLGENPVQGKYNADLFSSVDSEMTEINKNANDKYTLTSEVWGQNFWDMLFGKDSSHKLESETFNNIKAIQQVKKSDFKSNIEETCKNLYIEKEDYDNFKSYFDTATAQNETVYIFRYYQDKYISKPVTECNRIRNSSDDEWNNTDYLKIIDTNAYQAQMVVNLDFDIIDVTCRKADVITVIPVVSNPIEIIPDITPPVNMPDFSTPESKNWLKIILTVIFTVILIVLVIWLVFKLIDIIRTKKE